jgi:hypothetical protein
LQNKKNAKRVKEFKEFQKECFSAKKTILLYILVSPSANSRLYYAPSGKALTLGLKNMVKFAEGEQAINPTLKMYSSMEKNTLFETLYITFLTLLLFVHKNVQ